MLTPYCSEKCSWKFIKRVDLTLNAASVRSFLGRRIVRTDCLTTTRRNFSNIFFHRFWLQNPSEINQTYILLLGPINHNIFYDLGPNLTSKSSKNAVRFQDRFQLVSDILFSSILIRRSLPKCIQKPIKKMIKHASIKRSMRKIDQSIETQHRCAHWVQGVSA